MFRTTLRKTVFAALVAVCCVTFAASADVIVTNWDANTHYTTGQVVQYNGINYQCTVTDVWYWPPTDNRYFVAVSQSVASDTVPAYWANYPKSITGNKTQAQIATATPALLTGTIGIIDYNGYPECVSVQILNNGAVAWFAIEPSYYTAEALKRLMGILMLAKGNNLTVQARCLPSVSVNGSSYRVLMGLQIQ